MGTVGWVYTSVIFLKIDPIVKRKNIEKSIFSYVTVPFAPLLALSINALVHLAILFTPSLQFVK